jgi:glucosamine-phosphate N-acetyltransferase
VYVATSVVAIERQHMEEVIELLQSMSSFQLKNEEYDDIWKDFKGQSNVHSVVVVEEDVVIGYGSVVIETKIRGGKIGHIEDIVSHNDYRKRGIGKMIVDSLYEIARTEGCYKVLLQCEEHNIPFYEKCGYELYGLAMQRLM